MSRRRKAVKRHVMPDPKYNDKIIYPDKVSINLHYYHNHNLYTDIKIIFATIFRKYY